MSRVALEARSLRYQDAWPSVLETPIGKYKRASAESYELVRYASDDLKYFVVYTNPLDEDEFTISLHNDIGNQINTFFTADDSILDSLQKFIAALVTTYEHRNDP
jgi:hypothetical protein